MLSELSDYQVMPEGQLPSINVDAQVVDSTTSGLLRMEKPSDTTQKRFSNLVRLCKTLLVLPHSNADPERLFSVVRKVETEQRASLNPATVHDLLSVKMNTDLSCFDCH